MRSRSAAANGRKQAARTGLASRRELRETLISRWTKRFTVIANEVKQSQTVAIASFRFARVRGGRCVINSV